MITLTRWIVCATVAVTLASCSGGSHTFQCTDNASCNLSAGGLCVATGMGASWCAYPDQCCPSGYRYSEQDVGDGLAGTCTAGIRYTLSVMIGGDGSGTITSDPEGLTCSSGMCTGKFDEGAIVQLSAVATSGSFLGWGNDCSGQGACTLNMDRDHTVGALFGIPGEALWADQFGGTDSDRGVALAIDSDENLIVVGEFTGTMMAGTNIEKLLAECDDHRYRVVILLASEAGLRVGEIRGLQWTDIKDGQLTVRRALDKETGEVIAPKHNKVRTVPLSPRIVAALAELPRRGLWVVSRLDGGALNYYELSRAVNAIYDRANVTRPRSPVHCMRHTFGTVMARRVPLGVLQQLMGHADVQTTMRYVDVSEDDKREAIAAVFGVRGSHVAAANKVAS